VTWTSTVIPFQKGDIMAKDKVIKGAENNATTAPINLVDVMPKPQPKRSK
jgi:hypothetical protein